MRLTLRRAPSSSVSTIGELFVDGLRLQRDVLPPLTRRDLRDARTTNAELSRDLPLRNAFRQPRPYGPHVVDGESGSRVPLTGGSRAKAGQEGVSNVFLYRAGLEIRQSVISLVAVPMINGHRRHDGQKGFSHEAVHGAHTAPAVVGEVNARVSIDDALLEDSLAHSHRTAVDQLFPLNRHDLPKRRDAIETHESVDIAPFFGGRVLVNHDATPFLGCVAARAATGVNSTEAARLF